MVPDPTSIRSIAVTPSDVADAAVYCRENPGKAVLRVTPPFHGRMRARLHVAHGDRSDAPDAIYLEPDTLIDAAVLEAYPAVESEFDDLETTETEQIRKRRQRALEEWRERAAESIRESIDIDTAEGNHRVDVTTLG